MFVVPNAPPGPTPSLLQQHGPPGLGLVRRRLSSSTGAGLSAARQAVLQQRRREYCEKLQRGIRELETKEPANGNVRKLMKGLKMFVTTTNIGEDMRTVLLYPPTECSKSGRSFG